MHSSSSLISDVLITTDSTKRTNVRKRCATETKLYKYEKRKTNCKKKEKEKKESPSPGKKLGRGFFFRR
jgi:hypothetical protein